VTDHRHRLATGPIADDLANWLRPCARRSYISSRWRAASGGATEKNQLAIEPISMPWMSTARGPWSPSVCT
jgi:hypothetical protein